MFLPCVLPLLPLNLDQLFFHIFSISPFWHDFLSFAGHITLSSLILQLSSVFQHVCMYSVSVYTVCVHLSHNASGSLSLSICFAHWVLCRSWVHNRCCFCWCCGGDRRGSLECGLESFNFVPVGRWLVNVDVNNSGLKILKKSALQMFLWGRKYIQHVCWASRFHTLLLL